MLKMPTHPTRSASRQGPLRALVVLVMLLHVLAPLFAQESEAEKLFHQAEQADRVGDLPRAIDLYTTLVQKYPDVAAGHANLGVVLAHAGRLDEAALQYQKALHIDPENVAVTVNLAILHYKQAHYQLAATLLEPVAKEHPEKRQPLLLLSDCYMHLGKFREVVGLLDPVYAQDPTDRTVSYLLGRALLSTGEVERGSVVIDRVLRDGSSGEADLLIGERLLASGDHHAAAQTLRKAMELNPHLPEGWSLLGRALLDEDDFSGAAAAFHGALDIDPNDFDANLYLGGMLRHDGQFQEAIPYLEKALHLRPDDVKALYQMGALKAAMGELEPALKYLEPVAQRWPEFQQVHVQLALVYQRLHRMEDSARERQIVFKLDERERQSPKPKP